MYFLTHGTAIFGCKYKIIMFDFKIKNITFSLTTDGPMRETFEQAGSKLQDSELENYKAARKCKHQRHIHVPSIKHDTKLFTL